MVAKDKDRNSPTENDILITKDENYEYWEIPHKAPTRYLSHDYFRYIGKFPPQIVRKFFDDYLTKGVVVDPMCGGGTTLIESMLQGMRSYGFDINPVSRLISQVATRPLDPEKVFNAINVFTNETWEIGDGQNTLWSINKKRKIKPVKPKNLFGNEKYFSSEAIEQISLIQNFIDDQKNKDIANFFQIALLAIFRQVSLANVKKMNVEIDETKTVKKVMPTFLAKINEMGKINEALSHCAHAKVVVESGDARDIPLRDNFCDMAVLHPPYMTNTAFSESVQLQLAWLGHKQRDIWKNEIAVRGSYIHRPDGLRKYLVDWFKILKESYRILTPNGYCCAVIGDGQIDYVRIPAGSITEEFGKDLGFKVVKRARHILNNNTGRTLNRRMSFQEIVIFQK
jgi:hypothetical protein